MNKPILEINLYEPWTECWACGIETPARWGLPIGTNAELVPNDYDGEWGGVPACEKCYGAHAQGLLDADTIPGWRRRAELEQRAVQAAFARE